jgi:hypothetical protein
MISLAYRRLIQLGKVTGAISFLLAAPYAVVEYWQAKDSARIEQTLTFYKLYNAKPFTDYRENITRALAKNSSKLNEAAVSESKLLDAMSEIVQSEDIEMDLSLVFDFFDGVAVCVSSGVCDDETAVKLFKPRALGIYLNF